MYSYNADIWAMGVILYELLVGITPFNAATVQELKFLQEVGVKYWYNAEVSAAGKDLIQKCLKFD